MRSGLFVALLAVVLLAAPAGAASSVAAPLADPTTTYTFALQEDGDANVTVAVEYTLESANQTEAFRDVGADFEDGRVGPSAATFERAASAASEATGREMSITAVQRNATIRNGTDESVGRLELTFQWERFAVADDGRLRVGDAYEAPNGTWLPGLRDDQRLRVVAPDGYAYDDGGEGNLEDGALVWDGPTRFDPGDLQVVVSGDGPTPPEPPNRGPTTSEQPNGSGPDEPGGEGLVAQLFSPAVGGPLVVVALGLVGLYAFVSRWDGEEVTGATAVDGGATPEGTADPADAPAAAASPEPSAEGDPDATDDTGEEGPFAGVDEELLSDEERVERLLEFNGGRMKQATIVTETGWSNAKVSQLLSAMDDAGRVDKLRIGRENLISLPEVDNGTGENGGS